MGKSLFTVGIKQSIPDVLQNKDRRAFVQKKLCQQFPEDVVVALKLNVPGPIKNNDMLQQLFWIGFRNLKSTFQKRRFGKPKKLVSWDKVTGSESFVVYEASPLEAKKVATTFENEFFLGRLFDADVISKRTDFKPVPRTALNMPTRRCLLCNCSAKECARSRKHSVAELQAQVSKIWQEFQN